MYQLRLFQSLLLFLLNITTHLPIHYSSLPSLLDATVEQLQFGLSNGDFSSVDLVQAYIRRINEVNGILSAVTQINPDALDIARDLDRERAEGKSRGPLHGLPVLLKDNIATNDSLSNTAGSYALLNARTANEATIVTKLRKAGAIILGKTNLSEWAMFRSLNTSNGWSALGGQTKGAYVLDQDPEGSSSGSAVGVSVGLSVAAIGTETFGSITLPASVNNIVGIKPTVGLTSRYLVVPISERADSIGPLARTVKDAAYFLQAMVGPDIKDNYTFANPHQTDLIDYVAACKEGSLSGRTFGVPHNILATLMPNATAETEAFKQALQTIEKAGGIVVEANFTLLEEYLAQANRLMTTMFGADFVVNLAAYFSQLNYNPQKLNSLQDVVDFIKTTPIEEYPYRDVGKFETVLDLGFNNSDYRAYQAQQHVARLGGEGGLLGALSRNKADAIVLPTSIAYNFANVLGTPAISVPLGAFPKGTTIRRNRFGNLVDEAPNYPFGLCFFGKHWSEVDLISFAHSFEALTRIRSTISPLIVPKAELKPF